jgi:hypothetical protein
MAASFLLLSPLFTDFKNVCQLQFWLSSRHCATGTRIADIGLVGYEALHLLIARLLCYFAGKLWRVPSRRVAHHERSRYAVFVFKCTHVFQVQVAIALRITAIRRISALIVDAPVSTLYSHLDIPVTCKIRKVGTEANTLALARMLQDHGAQVLTVHGRTRHQKQQFTGQVDWEIIRKIKFVEM